MLSFRNIRRRAFLLMEVLIGVAVFAVGVVTLGRCLAECLKAEALRMEERNIRVALEGAMAEILASPVLPNQTDEKKLEGTDPEITIKQIRKPAPFKNEQNVLMQGLYEITLTASWETRGEKQEQSISFFLFREN